MSSRSESERHRVSKRRTSRVVLEARAQGRTSPVQLYDVSVAGCRIDCALLDLSRDDRICFKFADAISVCGRIAWRRGDIAGVEFTTTLPDAIARHFQP